MTQETDQFLQAEEAAEKLVNALQNLHTSVNSYKTATEDLNLVRERLIQFINSTEVLAKNTHELIKTVNEIGAPQILAKLEVILREISDESSKNVQRHSQLKTFSMISIAILIMSLIGIVILLLK